MGRPSHRLWFLRSRNKRFGPKLLIPLPGRGAAGRVKQAVLRALPDWAAEPALAAAGYFLFATAHKGTAPRIA